MATDADRFARLFRGNDRSRGVFYPESGKMSTEHSPATIDNYTEHLNGICGLGVVPIMDDAKCFFGAIDIDAHGDSPDINITALEAKVRALELPLVVCRSKSGGAHLYVFGSDPLPAHSVRSLLSHWAKELGFPGVEVFPKQSNLPFEEGGERAMGNWINLPYFNASETNRYAVVGGKPVDLDMFLSTAETTRLTEEDLAKHCADEHPEAPPCMQKMMRDGVPNGYRNEALYNVTLYMKKAFPDDFRDRSFEFNYKYMGDPLEHSEARKTISSASRRNYRYRCSEEPIKSLCDRETCLKRKYGISKSDAQQIENEDSLPEFTDLRKYTTNPVRWVLKVDGTDLTVSTATLMDFRRMREAIADNLTRLLPMISGSKWNDILNKLMADARVIEAPDEASVGGMIRFRLNEYIHKADMSSSGDNLADREAMLRGVPVVQVRDNRRVVMFRASDFIDYLKRTKSEELKGPNLWLELRYAGLEHCRVRAGAGANAPIVSAWYVNIDDEGEVELDVPNIEPEF